MTATRWKAPALFCAALSPFLLAGCSQTMTHGMSVAKIAESITPTVLKARAYRYSSRDRECLERAMYFESNRSSRDGMVAVGTVVMNRLRSGKHGDTICAVVGERNQFAPGVMTRKMNSRVMPLVHEASAAVLKGERSAKLKNAMFFHTAGLKFPYKNMHYVLVAGGNAFYEKRGRNWKPLPPETMVAFSGPTPQAEPGKPAVMVASAAPAAGALPGVTQALVAAPQSSKAVGKPTRAPAARTAAVASAMQAPRPETGPFALASAEQPDKPARKRIVDPALAPLPTARASMFNLAAARPEKPGKAKVVQVAIEEPIAARFGRAVDASPGQSAASLGFAQ